MRSARSAKTMIGGAIALPIMLVSFLAVNLGPSNEAWAGSSGDPEVQDACPETMPDQQLGFADVCAAWFEAAATIVDGL